MPDRAYARLRVRKDQAVLLHRLVWQERGRMTRERAHWRTITPTTTFNQIIALLDATRREFERIAEEEGWELGQPWEPDEEGSGPRTSPAVPERVG